MDERYWILDALSTEDTSKHNRINEARRAVGMNVVGLVDEEVGGVIGYLFVDVADGIVDRLNRDLTREV